MYLSYHQASAEERGGQTEEGKEGEEEAGQKCRHQQKGRKSNGRLKSPGML